MVFFEAGGTKDGDAGPDKVEGPKAPNKFGKYSDGPKEFGATSPRTRKKVANVLRSGGLAPATGLDLGVFRPATGVCGIVGVVDLGS
jgi:hypothetical protein